MKCGFLISILLHMVERILNKLKFSDILITDDIKRRIYEKVI